MDLSSLYDLFAPWFLEPVSMIIIIIFDRILSISIIMFGFYGAIMLIRHMLKQRITPYVRFYMWYFVIAGLIISKSTFLPMVILNPVYTIMSDSFGMTYIVGLNIIAAIIWLTIVIAKTFVYLKNRSSFINYLDKYPEVINCSAFDKAYIVSGINKNIRLIASNKAKSPASFGVKKKYIILPQDYEDKYTDDELINLFLHELVHIRRKDTCKNLILDIFSIVFWVNPIVNKMIQTYRDDCKILCDLAVLSIPGVNANDYGKLLIKELHNKNQIQFAVGLNNDFNYMRNRLIAIRGFSPGLKFKRRNRIAITFIALASLAICISVIGVSPNPKQNNVLLVADYNDGTSKIIELSDNNANILLSSDKAVINAEYFLNAIPKNKNVQSVNVLVMDISVGLFAVHSRDRNSYWVENINLAPGIDNTIELPSVYDNRHRALQSLYSCLIKAL